MDIHFHLDSSGLKLPNRNTIKSWLGDVLTEEGYVLGRINIILTSDQKLLELNREFLSEDTFTDVLTFEYSDRGKIEGDIFVSVERVMENAEKYKVSYNKELMRVFVHGLLHLVGYCDKMRTDKINMRAKEDYYLKNILPDL